MTPNLVQKGLARGVKERLSRGRSIQIDNLKDENKSARAEGRIF